MLPVTITGCGHDIDMIEGIPQNKVQLDSISSNRKRKFEGDTDETNSPAPVELYGIVTDAEMWTFLQCTINTLQKSDYNDPVFHSSAACTRINYFADSDKWEADVKTIFEHVIWQLQRMVDDSPKNKRLKTETSK